MCSVQGWLFNADGFIATLRDTLNGTISAASFSATHHVGIWDVDRTNARAKLHPGRLRDQMFAYTVTGQVTDTFTEIGLPFLLRWFDAFRKGKTTMKGLVSFGNGGDSAGVKKRVVFEDEKEKGGMEERAFLDSVREEAALPEYDLFVDYNEMVVQFGYVVLWSTIWPLAGGKPLIFFSSFFGFSNLSSHPTSNGFHQQYI
jgi:anoctamin-10